MTKLIFIPLAVFLVAFTIANTQAAPKNYVIDSNHTYPSFEADHLGGFSVWRGKFNKTIGKITLDREAKTGHVEAVIDIGSIDFGNDNLNKHALAPDLFDVQKFPQAVYRGTFSKFNGDTPTEIRGELTLRDVTKPLTLTIKRFKCLDSHPMRKKEVCGADAYTELNRGDFGVSYGLIEGHLPEVRLMIQVEAIKEE
ncbi:MAG: YceI family protein [Burkholderiales bacterium]|jgi:polyisoprenoid-binding protein YceI|nr:YceI family protein [Burkholderiales bacterium]